MGDDILFLVLVALIFFIGISAYKFESFESTSTPEGQLYQTQTISNITTGVTQNTNNALEGISSMINGITNDIQSKINSTKDYIEGCVSYVQHCGKEPYPSTCSREHCWSYKCKCGFGGCSTCRDCKTVNYGCTKWRSKCTPKYPLWTCSPKPSGYSSPPGFPSGWRR